MNGAIVIEDCGGVVAVGNISVGYDHVIVARRSNNLVLSGNQAFRTSQQAKAAKSEKAELDPAKPRLKSKAMLWGSVSLIGLLADLKALWPFQ